MFIGRRLDKPKRIVLYCQTKFGILQSRSGIGLINSGRFLWSVGFWRIGI